MPKSQKPRRKHGKKHVKKPQLPPLVAHGACPAIIRERTDAGPHKFELFCTHHQQHVIWVSPAMAPLWQAALAKAGTISSSDGKMD